MELSTVWSSVRRRWYLVVLAFGLAAAAAVLAVGRVGPSYTAQGTMLLFPPEGTTQAGEAIEGNPYLFLGDLNPARDILIRSMTSKTTRETVAKEFPDTSYEMVADIAVSGPIVLIEVSAPTNDEAVGALNALMKRVPGRLARLQGALGIGETEYITVQELTADRSGELVHKDQIRAGVVVTGGTLVAGLFTIGLLDGLLMSRRGSRRQAPPTGRRPQAGDLSIARKHDDADVRAAAGR